MAARGRSGRIGNWLDASLPQHYRQVRDDIGRVQAALVELLPAALSERVQVISVTGDDIVVAVTDAQTANYLRLYQKELQQQLRESLPCTHHLRFRTLPQSLLQPPQRSKGKGPRPVSDEVADGVARNARWVEDDALREALASLAQSIKSRR